MYRNSRAVGDSGTSFYARLVKTAFFTLLLKVFLLKFRLFGKNVIPLNKISTDMCPGVFSSRIGNRKESYSYLTSTTQIEINSTIFQ